MVVYWVTPGIVTSAGHDKVMDLARRATPCSGGVEALHIARTDGAPLVGLGWRLVEVTRQLLARAGTGTGAGARVMTRLAERGAAGARESSGFSSFLAAPYRGYLSRKRREGTLARVVSSHYLALLARPSGWPGTLLGPDLLAQPAVAGITPPRVALSPCRTYSDGLVRQGFRVDEILETGPLLPEAFHAGAALRRARRQDCARGLEAPEVLVAVGGAAPEAASVVELVEALAHRRLRAHVLVGDGRPHAVALRRRLERIGGYVEVYGGLPGLSRQGELDIYHELLLRPELTAWATRPNEGAVLASALDFELWLLPPYQAHERWAADALEKRGVEPAEALKRGAAPGRPVEPLGEGFVRAEPPSSLFLRSEIREALSTPSAEDPPGHHDETPL